MTGADRLLAPHPSEDVASAGSGKHATEPGRHDLLAWVAHDLRSPLAGIVAMAEALEDGVVAEPGDVARYHATMRREAGRLAAMVADLLLLCRLRSGGLQLRLAATALDELVGAAVAGADVIAAPKGVVVTGRIGAPCPVAAVSAPEMSRVLQNLLDNAVRHTPAGGVVSVEATVAGRGPWALVSVQDGCGGMAPERLARAFDPAPRPAGTRRAGGGHGLGLVIAHRLTEAHGGRISVRNQGSGCRFTLRLPFAPSAPGSCPTAAPGSPLPACGPGVDPIVGTRPLGDGLRVTHRQRRGEDDP